MSSLRSHEGYALLDHRDSPGVSPELEAKCGLPIGCTNGRMLELPTFTCSHCETVVMINPDRQRERAFCRKCNHRLCDRCGVVLAQTFECVPFKVRIQQEQERLFLAEQRGLPADLDTKIILP